MCYIIAATFPTSSDVTVLWIMVLTIREFWTNRSNFESSEILYFKFSMYAVAYSKYHCPLQVYTKKDSDLKRLEGDAPCRIKSHKADDLQRPFLIRWESYTQLRTPGNNYRKKNRISKATNLIIWCSIYVRFSFWNCNLALNFWSFKKFEESIVMMSPLYNQNS